MLDCHDPVAALEHNPNTILEYFHCSDIALLTEESLHDKLLSKRYNDQYYAILGLRLVGTSKIVPTIKKVIQSNLASKSTEIIEVALLTLGVLCKEDCTEYYSRFVKSKYSESIVIYALWTLNLYGDIRALPCVKSYVKKKYLDKESSGGHDVIHGTIFLFRYYKKEDSELKNILLKLLKKWPRICSKEERTYRVHIEKMLTQ